MEQAAFSTVGGSASELGKNRQICSRCFYDSRIPKIVLDEQGVCNYCHMIDGLKAQHGTGTKEVCAVKA